MRDLKKAGPLREAAKDLSLEVLALDVDSAASVKRAVAQVVRKAGRVDMLVNNAGWGAFGALEEFTDAEIKAQFETNVFGLLRVTKAVLPLMRQQGGGKILHIGSLAGRMTFAGIGLYCATKHSVEAITESLRLEVRPFNIQVSVLEPGTIRTPFKANRRKAKTFLEGRSAYQKTLEGILWFGDHPPASAPGPREVAEEVVWVLSKERMAVRYRIGGDAVWYPRLRWFLPDWVFDKILQRRYEGFKKTTLSHR
jgi:NAD(P)-dependent dehydrogenase (short-subunit alcohol dehydrogenase family)